MRVLRNLTLAGVAALMLPVLAPAALAQDGGSLADIRQALGRLYSDINGLRAELSTTGQLSSGVSGNTPLDRLNSIEAELVRLTSKAEELEFRINRITTDGTNRIGDLEFRICELEPGCDISLLGDTPSLGGVDSGAAVPVAQPAAPAGPALTASEQADFTRAQEALASGDFRGASDLFASFVTAYPGGPMTGEAMYLRGEALEGLGQVSDAARSYLDSYSGDPDGIRAPDALWRLGALLGQLGQPSEACITLGQLVSLFPGTQAAQSGAQERTRLACQ